MNRNRRASGWDRSAGASSDWTAGGPTAMMGRNALRCSAPRSLICALSASVIGEEVVGAR
jgi:hypothetical protein